MKAPYFSGSDTGELKVYVSNRVKTLHSAHICSVPCATASFVHQTFRTTINYYMSVRENMNHKIFCTNNFIIISYKSTIRTIS